MDGWEDQWLERLRGREPAALQHLMEVFGPRVHALVARVLGGLGSRLDIEECVSDVFVAAWNRTHEFDERRGAWSTWLFVLAKYKALDYRRRLAAQPISETLAHEPPDERDGPEEEALRQAMYADMLRLLDTLGELDRAIFYKRYFYYEPLETIARDLKLSRKAVENRLRRGRMELKRRFQAEGEGWT